MDAPRPQGQWALAWRRFKRDRVAVGCGIFLLVLLFAVGPGAPLYEKIVGHGPNDFFPYAVSVGLRPAGPRFWRLKSLVFPLCSAIFWIRRWTEVTYDEIGRGISAGLAGNIPAIAVFRHRIFRLLPRPIDRGRPARPKPNRSPMIPKKPDKGKKYSKKRAHVATTTSILNR